MIMVSSQHAGRLLGGLTSEMIRRYAEDGLLPYTRKGLRGIYSFCLDDVRTFAESRKRYFDYELANKLAAQQQAQ